MNDSAVRHLQMPPSIDYPKGHQLPLKDRVLVVIGANGSPKWVVSLSGCTASGLKGESMALREFIVEDAALEWQGEHSRFARILTCPLPVREESYAPNRRLKTAGPF